VLLVHGGPHALYGTSFFHEFQVLAAAGYVVVFSNPRGSKGYGEDHCAAIQGRWGEADWADVQAVAGFMEQHPDIDPRRIGIAGGSYGGYMTNWAITHSDRFAAAITDRCVSNLISMAGSSDYPLVPGEYWPGNPWDDSHEIWRQSPIRSIRNASTPTLVIHSEGDLRCNVEQGEQVYAALKMLGVPTRFVRYPGETSHGMSRCGPPDLRIHRLGEILAWWKKHL
jgi:dipeptidyl aminopeptidase/acylaminoacyl peptidase